MTDSQREERIKALNKQIENYYFNGRIDLARETITKRDDLIRMRSAKQIKKMEKERGLA